MKPAGLPAPRGEINVTPLVDVVLVLLIVFLIAAPTLHQGLVIDLPKTAALAAKSEHPPVIIRVDRRQRVFLEKRRVPLDRLGLEVRGLFSGTSHTRREVFIEADKSLPYGLVVDVMARAQEGGADGITMLTSPP
ncbi:MAG: biopolymer transporter ExbD [Myxococcota bacterium]